jgi:hypothetical protein
MVTMVVAAAVLLGSGVPAGRLPVLAAQSETAAMDSHALVGSWEVALSFDSTTPAIVNELGTFGADGTLLVATTGELVAIPTAGSDLLFTEGHGVWTATGEQTGDATFKYLMLDPSGGVFSTSTIRMRLEADASGDGYGGSFTLTSISPDGAAMGEGRGMIEATRIVVEPLDMGAATPTS